MEMTAAELLEAALDGTLSDDDAQTITSTETTTEQPAGDEPAVAAADEAPAEQAPEAEAQQGEPTEAGAETEAPIQSRSGAYTIPYQKLVDARTERDALREEVAALKQQLSGLTVTQQQNLAVAQGAAQGRADAGQAQTQADGNLAAATQAIAGGVDVAIFGDFSEESIARGVAELNRRTAEAIRAEMQETLRTALTPLRETVTKSADQLHLDAIFATHPDAFEIVESAEFEAWRNGLPAFARAGVEHAIANGSPQEVVEVLDAFRGAAAAKPQAQQEEQQQQTAVRPALEAPKPRVPNSLSEVPGAAPADETQQTLAMAGNSGALLDRMATMTPDQLDALMNRI